MRLRTKIGSFVAAVCVVGAIGAAPASAAAPSFTIPSASSLSALCKNIKDSGIQVYTILVMEGNAQLLQSCASKPDMFFALQSAGEIVTAFNAIGIKLSKLRVAK